MVAEFPSFECGDLTSVEFHLYRQLMQGKGHKWEMLPRRKQYLPNLLVFDRHSIVRPTFRALQAANPPPPLRVRIVLHSVRGSHNPSTAHSPIVTHLTSNLSV
jgi:hypothetical protein